MASEGFKELVRSELKAKLSPEDQAVLNEDIDGWWRELISIVQGIDAQLSERNSLVAGRKDLTQLERTDYLRWRAGALTVRKKAIEKARALKEQIKAERIHTSQKDVPEHFQTQIDLLADILSELKHMSSLLEADFEESP